MRVSATEDFAIVYSLLKHEYLSYVIDSHAVQRDARGKFTLRYQSVSPANIQEFKAGIDDRDVQLVGLVEKMRQETILKAHGTKKQTIPDFFHKAFGEAGNPIVKDHILTVVDRAKAQMLPLLEGKPFFIMGQDGNPCWQEVQFAEDQPTIRFHFFRNENDTQYYPTLKYRGHKLEFMYQNAIVLTNQPATVIIDGFLYQLAGNVEGKKLSPFLSKKFISVKRETEKAYFAKFVAPLIAAEDVVAIGFIIDKVLEDPTFYLQIEEIAQPEGLFVVPDSASKVQEINTPCVIRTLVNYGPHRLPIRKIEETTVLSEPAEGTYKFIKIFRDSVAERSLILDLKERGLDVEGGAKQGTLGNIIAWVQANDEWLQERNITVVQALPSGKNYCLDRPTFHLQAKKNIDWLEINGTVRFGPHEVPFLRLRTAILRGQPTIELPDGTILFIPPDWVEEYKDLFRFSKEGDEEDTLIISKLHAGWADTLVRQSSTAQLADWEDSNLAAQLAKPKPAELPKRFDGELREYQKFGYDWISTLRELGVGGCLADDMGLGKTIQTLAALQHVIEQQPAECHLLVVPNSLIYNWEREAKKFTPGIRILKHIGQSRAKSAYHFYGYHLVITSYGTLRADEKIFAHHPFCYLILDEAHAIKTHTSSTAKAARAVKALHRLSLTGTPVENNLAELWSQMDFLNPGMLGNLNYFKEQFANPIERNGNQPKMEKLQKLIQPFLLRRLKADVAKELPEKNEQYIYCEMSGEQMELYNKMKDAYRNAIFHNADNPTVQKSSFLLLRAITHMRQIACHPVLTDGGYKGVSGKFESICYKLLEAMQDGHKVLIFSQFTRHLRLVRDFVEAKGIDYAYLDGKTKNREAVVDKFNNEASCSLFLLALKAGGTGLNLTKADYVFLLDPWWNPATEAQAVDRAHRIGQQKKVFIYRFISHGTIEEKIIDLQERKRQMVNNLLQNDTSLLTSLSMQEIGGLFD